MNMVYVPLPYAQFPSRWAHSIEHMKMCEAFAQQGVDVRMIYHRRPFSRDGGDLLERVSGFYGLRDRFPVVTLPGLRVRNGLWRRLRVDSLSMAGTTAPYVLWRCLRGRLGHRDVIYTRNRAAGAVVGRLLRWLPRDGRPRVIYEAHEPEDAAFARLSPSLDGVVTISGALRDHLCAAHGVPRDRITVERCAADAEQFAASVVPQAEARRQLGLAGHQGPIIAYCGRIDATRGVDVLLRAAARFGERGWCCLIVGGSAEDVHRLPGITDIPPAVVCAGRVSPSDVPRWLSAADVLVAPHANRGQYDQGSSPLKLFEYMATRRPVVSTRVAAVEEIVRDQEHAVLVSPGSPDALLRGIAWVIEHPQEAWAMAARASTLAARHTWVARARRILDFIEHLPAVGVPGAASEAG